MSVRMIRVGLSLSRRGQPRTIRTVEVAAVLSFNQKTFAEIRSAARQTSLPLASYVQEVIENDFAARRVASPPEPNAKTGK